MEECAVTNSSVVLFRHLRMCFAPYAYVQYTAQYAQYAVQPAPSVVQLEPTSFNTVRI